MDLLRQIVARLKAAEDAPPLRLSEIESPLPAVEHAPPAPLNPADARRLLAALPPLPEEAPPEETPPPAVPAPAAAAPALPPAPPPEPAPAELAAPTIVMASPVGPVKVVDRVSITFSQPMAAVQPHETLDRADVPVTLAPEPPGFWRWQDSRTLVFTPAERFPMATEYAVAVAPLRALAGGLSEPAAWTFTTSPPALSEAVFPTLSNAAAMRQTPPIALIFDQAVDADAIEPFLLLTANGEPLEFGRASAEELRALQADKADRFWLDEHEDHARHAANWVAIRPIVPLPRDSRIEVTVLAGAPSAEGPLRTTGQQSRAFRTHGPLRLSLHPTLGKGGKEWFISGKPALVAEGFEPAMISIEPPLPFRAIMEEWGNIAITADFAAGVEYTVTVAPGMRDVFEQTLDEPFVATFMGGDPWADTRPRLFVPERSFVAIEAHRPWIYTVYSRGHTALRVRLRAVGPEHWGRFNTDWEELGSVVGAAGVAVAASAEPITATVIDLRPLCAGRIGQYILEIEPDGFAPPQPWEAQRLRVWVQISGLDLAACVCDPQLFVWASAADGGAALPEVALELRTASALEPGGWLPGSVAATSGPDGRAMLDEPGSANLLIAHSGADLAMLPIANRQRLFATLIDNGRGRLRWYVLSDRGVYRPGETVSVKGWLRVAGVDHGLALPAAASGSYLLTRGRSTEISRGQFAIGPTGGFDLALDLPADAATETHLLTLALDGYPVHVQRIEVQEFRRPEFTVTVGAAPGPWVAGDRAEVTVEAGYYAAGPVSGAEVSWRVTAGRKCFSTPAMPSAGWSWDYRHYNTPPPASLRGQTDAAGRHTLAIDLGAVLPEGPLELTVEATVIDRNRQAWSASTTLLAHPARLYPGLRFDDSQDHDRDTRSGEMLVVDLDGRPVAGRDVLIRLNKVNDRGKPLPGKPAAQLELRSAAEPIGWSCTLPAPGRYQATAYVIDDHGGLNWSSQSIFLLRQQPPVRPRSEPKPTLRLTADRESYRPGATALLTIAPTFVPARGLLSLHGAGAPRITPVEIHETASQVALNLPPEIAPNAQAELILFDPLGADQSINAPLRARATARLAIEQPSQRLSLDVRPRSESGRPGELIAIDFAVSDAAGQPLAGAEIAVFVVDQAVLDLTGYRLADPIAAWYPYDELHSSAHSTRQHIQRPNAAEWNPIIPDDLLGSGLKGGWGWNNPGLITPPGMRLDFSPLALFAPSLRADESGRASVSFRLPDNLTRYRVMAVAVHGAGRIGHAEAAITVGLPLMVSLAPPRFLRPGDRCLLTAQVHNRTDRPLDVALAARAARLDLAGTPGYALRIPPLSRAECVIEARAPVTGPATLQVIASTGALTDALSLTIPIRQPAASAISATYGELADTPVIEAIQVPPAALPEVGGLEISLASSSLQQISDAVGYLVAYPYGCAEQRASRLLALRCAQDHGAAFAPADLPALVAEDLARLLAAQRADGGWGLWAGAETSWPYVSAHVAYALSGWPGADPALAAAVERSADYLEQLDQTLTQDQPVVRLSVLAYALFVLGRLGRPQGESIQRLLASIEVRNLPAEAAAWLLAALAAEQATPWRDQLRQHLLNQLHQIGGAAHVRTGYRDQGQLLLFSERRADAVALAALLADQPESAAVQPLARGLLDGRRLGRWGTTQENAFAVLALASYHVRFAATPPEGVVQTSLDGRPLPEQRLSGHGQSAEVRVPMAELIRYSGPVQVGLRRQGSGRLHYRVALKAALAEIDLPALSHGFSLERRYAGAERARDVGRREDGGWRFAAGALVEVVIRVLVGEERHHVALVDPIPAGCEILNAALATSSRVAAAGGDGWRWPVRHIYDDRIEVFASYLPPGRHTLTYTLRATGAGAFAVPGTWAEEMYRPEVAGRSIAAQVLIE